METNFVNLEGEGEGWVIYSISSDPPPPRIVYRLYCKGETPSGLANLPPPPLSAVQPTLSMHSRARHQGSDGRRREGWDLTWPGS